MRINPREILSITVLRHINLSWLMFMFVELKNQKAMIVNFDRTMISFRWIQEFCIISSLPPHCSLSMICMCVWVRFCLMLLYEWSRVGCVCVCLFELLSVPLSLLSCFVCYVNGLSMLILTRNSIAMFHLSVRLKQWFDVFEMSM